MELENFRTWLGDRSNRELADLLTAIAAEVKDRGATETAIALREIAERCALRKEDSR